MRILKNLIAITGCFVLLSSTGSATSKKCEAWGGCYEAAPRLSDEEMTRGIRSPLDLQREEEAREKTKKINDLYKQCTESSVNKQELDECKTICPNCN